MGSKLTIALFMLLPFVFANGCAYVPGSADPVVPAKDYPIDKRLTDDEWREMLYDDLKSVGIKDHSWIYDYAVEAGYDD